VKICILCPRPDRVLLSALRSPRFFSSLLLRVSRGRPKKITSHVIFLRCRGTFQGRAPGLFTFDVPVLYGLVLFSLVSNVSKRLVDTPSLEVAISDLVSPSHLPSSSGRPTPQTLLTTSSSSLSRFFSCCPSDSSMLFRAPGYEVQAPCAGFPFPPVCSLIEGFSIFPRGAAQQGRKWCF